MAGSVISRRLSEVLGVGLFALSVLWLIALVSYSPADPVWFFSTETGAPANFAGRVGAFLAELSFQLFGYGSYLLPAVLAVSGWHYFWCRAVDAVYTKIVGAVAAIAMGVSWERGSTASLTAVALTARAVVVTSRV